MEGVCQITVMGILSLNLPSLHLFRVPPPIPINLCNPTSDPSRDLHSSFPPPRVFQAERLQHAINCPKMKRLSAVPRVNDALVINRTAGRSSRQLSTALH